MDPAGEQKKPPREGGQCESVKTVSTDHCTNRGNVKKIAEAAAGRQWHLKVGRYSAVTWMDRNGIWQVEWDPHPPKTATRSGKFRWARYMQWRNEIVQELADTLQMEIWAEERVCGSIVAQCFRPRKGGSSD